MKNKIITAFKDNHKDLLKASRYDDYEEAAYCRGYEQAMIFVLGLLGIGYDEALHCNANKECVMSKWSEIRNDFVCEDLRKIYIDAWITDDDNEEGIAIARICMDTKRIEYFDDDAKLDAHAQEIINETLSEIDNGKYDN